MKHVMRRQSSSQKQAAIIAVVLGLGAAVGSMSVFGLGLAVPDQDAFATARGNAFVATANDPAAVFYNPAGISQLGGANVSLGAYGIVLGDRYSSGKDSVDSKTEWSILPQVFSTYSLSNYNFTFGLGVYSPYGLRMEWPTSAPFLAAGETAQVSYLRAAGIISWQIVPSFSIAAGPNLNYSDADLKEFPGFVNHFAGRATDAGYTAGILYHPWEQHYFGLTYRSATEMNYNGHATALGALGPTGANLAASADFHFPETLAFGYSFRPTAKWNVEADVNWSDWSELKSVPLISSPPLPSIDTLNFNWRPSWMVDLGVTRYVGNDWRISGGWMYSMNSVPDANFNPLVPDSDRFLFSLGVGKKCGPFSWDVAYQFGWGPSRTVAGDTSPSIAPGLPDGNYEFFNDALSLNIGYHF